MNEQDKSGWVSIQTETDEFYGVVQWRDKDGNMTDKKEPYEHSWDWKGNVFVRAGLGKLEIVL